MVKKVLNQAFLFILVLVQSNICAQGISVDSATIYFDQVKEYSEQGQKGSATFYLEKLELFANNASDYKKIIEAFRIYGHLLEEEGSYDACIDLYRKGVDYANQYGDRKYASMMLIDISQAYRIFHNYDLALEYGKEALLVLGDQINTDIQQRINAQSIVAAAFTEKGLLDSALKYQLELMDFLPQIDSAQLRGNMINLGYTYMELGQLEECRYWTEAGLRYFKDGVPYELATVYTNLAMYGNRADKLPYSLRMFDSALFYMDKSPYIETLVWIYEERAEVYEKMKKYDLAIKDLESLQMVKDSIFKTERDLTVQEMEAKYQADKKEQQIANQSLMLAEEKALNQRNSFFILALLLALAVIVVVVLYYRNVLSKKQQQQLHQKDLEAKALQMNAIISSQENERKRFASDLHDGFGQMISILKMNVESLKNNGTDKAERSDIFNKSKEMLDEMYDELRGICFNLMPQTLVKNGLIEALKEFASRINVSGKVNVEIHSFGMEDRLTDLQEISLYRVIQEWVNNTLKYGDATNISIQITRDEVEMTLTIEDNGMGFDKNLLFDSKGNGWKNIQSRANLIQSEIEMDTKENQQNSTFILNAPSILTTKTIRVST